MATDYKTAEKILKRNGVGVMPTDTMYGLIGCALSKKSVNKVYELRKRNPKKPFIILIGSVNDLKLFNVKIDSTVQKRIKNFWPGQVSIILPCPYKKFEYLHRGAKSLAFRLPKKKKLVSLLKKTGPLIAPSANLEGMYPARSIEEAEKYFGNKADFYLNEGRMCSLPSTLIEMKNGKINILRQGMVKINF